MRAMIPAVALISALLLSACGIKGPLFLPEKPQAKQSSDTEKAAGNNSKPDFNPASIPTPSR
ncbi:MAG: lipoprotein [Azoarcus sp.]|jgi:predicted small lipoprotein YifL